MELNMKKELLCLPLALALVACGDNDRDTSKSASQPPETPPAVTLQSLEDSGEIPKLDRSASLPGTDTDTNGIRDDIDEYISLQFSDTEQVAAANQAAKANQSVLSTDLTNPTAVRQTNQLISRATACIYEVFGDANSGAEPAVVSRNLEAVTFNTEERLKQYKEFNKALDGSSWSLPEGNSCE